MEATDLHGGVYAHLNRVPLAIETLPGFWGLEQNYYFSQPAQSEFADML